MDFQVGQINKALKLELAKSRPNGRYVIELLDRMALIDSNYDVLALRGHKPPDGQFEVPEEEVATVAPKQQTSTAVSKMLKEISEEKADGDATDRTS